MCGLLFCRPIHADAALLPLKLTMQLALGLGLGLGLGLPTVAMVMLGVVSMRRRSRAAALAPGSNSPVQEVPDEGASETAEAIAIP
jgi:hypothetical protein